MQEEKKLTPMKAIRAYCVKCKGQRKSLECSEVECPLHIYRNGKTGRIGKPLTEQQKAALRAKLDSAK